MYGYIYLRENLITGAKYIGQHKYNKPEIDWNYPGSGIKFLEDYFKLGPGCFSYEILEIINSKEEANKKEIYWIKKYNTYENNFHYNLTPGGESSPALDEATKKKLAISKTGQYASKETIEKLSLAHKGMKHTEETKRKISESQYHKTKEKTYTKHTLETIEKISKRLVGHKHSNETKQKISLNNSQTKLTKEDVLLIMELKDTISQYRIAKLFGVSRTTIQSIFQGKSWNWVTNIKGD